ncbi:universal stress protein [Egicoccus sp. AB-alg2]|uniref:universal stress protein n=1 Tax=Egicoccus sp. AB-alg2 TaxID=3242693 RepID=UPI00359E0AC5
MSYRHVVVGTDGSATAQRAVTAAGRVAAALDVPLVVVTAWRRELADPPPRSEEARYPGGNAASQESHWAVEVTSDAAGAARRLGVREVRQAQPIGEPLAALLEVVDRHPDALLVVGTRGLEDAGERLVGNLPHQLTHHSPVDLLLAARPHTDAGWTTVGLATDGSRTAARAVRRGLDLAQGLTATPVLLTVARDDARGQRVLAEVAADLGVDGSVRADVVVGGEVARALATAAAEVDLLVLGNKGMTGPSRLLGSVANRITHEVPTDLLLVNTTRRRA